MSLFCAAMGAVGCGGGADEPDGGADGGLPVGVAVRVGHTTIRESDVLAQLDAFYAPQGGTAKAFGPPGFPACVEAAKAAGVGAGESDGQIRVRCRETFDAERAQAVATLLQTEWLDREAKRQGIDATREIERTRALAKRLASHGHPASADDRKEIAVINRQKRLVPKNQTTTMRAAIERQKLMAAIPLTEREIADYANANSEVFLKSENRVARVVQTLTKAKALKARRQLQRHQSWRTIEARYQNRRYARHWWTGTQTVTKGTAPQDAFGRALFAAKPNTITGPIRTLDGWFVFQITAIHPPPRNTLPTSHRTSVTTTLRAKHLDQNLHNHYAAQTTCAPQYQTPEVPQCQPNPPTQ